METSFDFDEKLGTCIVHFSANMCQEESNALLNDLKKNVKVQGYSKFIVVIPESFTACEDFRIQIHRYIVTMRKKNPKFRIAIVTTLLRVIGYEQFAKTVIQMVDKEQIFDTMDKAIAWLKKQ